MNPRYRYVAPTLLIAAGVGLILFGALDTYGPILSAVTIGIVSLGAGSALAVRAYRG